jgi:predicted RNA-binding protein
MNYWLFVTTAENLKIITEKSFVGFPNRNEHALSRVKKGDKCLIYTKRGVGECYTPLVSGEYQIVSDVYVENTRVFNGPERPKEVFPLRLKLKRIGRPTDPVPFKPIVPYLAFIINKRFWGASLQGRGLINISEKDYLTIVSFLLSQSTEGKA